MKLNTIRILTSALVTVALLSSLNCDCQDCATSTECQPGPTTTSSSTNTGLEPVTGWRIPRANPVFNTSPRPTKYDDSSAVGAPAVIFDAEGSVFKMWYSAQNGTTNNQSDGATDDGNTFAPQEHTEVNDVRDDAYKFILYAESSDGEDWNRVSPPWGAGKPAAVLPSPAWESTPDPNQWWLTGSAWEGGVTSPTVLKEGTVPGSITYHMWFTGMWFYSSSVCDYLDPRDYSDYATYHTSYLACLGDPSGYIGANDPRIGKEPWFGPNTRSAEWPGPPCETVQLCEDIPCPDPKGCCGDVNGTPGLYDASGIDEQNLHACGIYRANSLLYSRSTDGIDWSPPTVIYHPQQYYEWPSSASGLVGSEPTGVHLIGASVIHDKMGTASIGDDQYRMWFTGSNLQLRDMAMSQAVNGDGCYNFTCYNFRGYDNDGDPAYPGVYGAVSFALNQWPSSRVMYTDSTRPDQWTQPPVAIADMITRPTNWDGSFDELSEDGNFWKRVSYNEVSVVQPWTDPTDKRNCNYLMFYNAGQQKSYASHIGVNIGKREADGSISWDAGLDIIGADLEWQREKIVSQGPPRTWNSGGLRTPAAVVKPQSQHLYVFYEGASYINAFNGGPRDPFRNGHDIRSIGMAWRDLAEIDSAPLSDKKPYNGDFYCPSSGV